MKLYGKGKEKNRSGKKKYQIVEKYNGGNREIIRTVLIESRVGKIIQGRRGKVIYK